MGSNSAPAASAPSTSAAKPPTTNLVWSCWPEFSTDLCANHFGHPTPSTRRRPRNCICSKTYRFQAIDARLPPSLRLLDAVQIAEGLRNNLTHWLISTQPLTPRPGRRSRANCRTAPRRCGRACAQIKPVSGPDNSSLRPFSTRTRPLWLRRAVRNRHLHAVEQGVASMACVEAMIQQWRRRVARL